MTIAAVILAAGVGSRFSGVGHKLLAEVRGKPVITWAVENALAAELDETIVIEGAIPLTAHVPESASIIRNEDWELGQAVSLQIAVQYASMAGHDAVVVGLGDMPGVPASAWKAVAEAPEEQQIVTASFGGQARPPVRLDGSVWPLLPMTGDEGARTLLRSRPELVVELACEGDPADIDTVEELKSWS